MHLIFPPSPASRVGGGRAGARSRLVRPGHTWRRGRARATRRAGEQAMLKAPSSRQPMYVQGRARPSGGGAFFRRRIMQTGEGGARARGRRLRRLSLYATAAGLNSDCHRRQRRGRTDVRAWGAHSFPLSMQTARRARWWRGRGRSRQQQWHVRLSVAPVSGTC